MGKTASQPCLSFGSVLARTWNMLFKKPVTFFGLTGGAILPAVLVETFMVQPDTLNTLSVILQVLASIWALAIGQGAIAHVVYQVLLDENAVSVDKAVSRSMASFPSVLATSLVMSAIIIAGLILSVVIAALVVNLVANAVIIVGSLLLIIPCLLLVCIFAITIPACVVERLGPFESLERSAELTRGSRWTIFFLLLLVEGTAKVTGYFMFFVVASQSDQIQAEWVETLFNIAFMAFGLVMLAIIYCDLWSKKEWGIAEAE